MKRKLLFLSPFFSIVLFAVENDSFLKTITLKKGLDVKLFASDPMVSNPVAFSIDSNGNVFVAESNRFSSSVIGTWKKPFLTDADRSSQSISDRLSMMKNYFGKKISEFEKESENIRLLKDLNGKGVATFSSLYATGFNGPLEGTAATILARNNKIWFGNIPSLWFFQGVGKDGNFKLKKELSRGYGVRFGIYEGHDLRGLVLGPDGKIYFSVGDRGSNIKSVEGNVFYFPEEGVIFRCDQDGKNLEVFARGFRNPAKLVFDNYGNLFTADNDCDRHDQERWLYVVQGGDYGWRHGYQYLEDAGPWNSENIWVAEKYSQNDYSQNYAHISRQILNSFLRDKNFYSLLKILYNRYQGFLKKLNNKIVKKDYLKRPLYVVPAIANIGNGPSGVAYYPGTGFGEDYKESFFVSHFAEGLQSDIHSFKLQERGAGFESNLINNEVFVYNAHATDINFGPDGALYFSNWGDSQREKSGTGRIAKVFDKDFLETFEVQQVKKILNDGMSEKNENDLLIFLSHSDFRVRLESQFELVKRGASSFPLLIKILSNEKLIKFEKIHALWAIEQLGNAVSSKVNEIYFATKDSDPKVRAQAYKTIGAFGKVDSFQILVQGLSDESARVQYFASIALGNIKTYKSVDPVLKMIEKNNDNDYFLMHAGVLALLNSADENQLLNISKKSPRSVRMAVVQVLRRKKSSIIAEFLADSDEGLVLEAVRAINDVPIETSFEALANILDRNRLNPLVLERAINVAFRIGNRKNAKRLIKLLERKDIGLKFKDIVLSNFLEWDNPSHFDKVTGLFRPFSKRDSSFLPGLIKEEFQDLAIFSSLTLSQKLNLLKIIGLYKIQGFEKILIEYCSSEKNSNELKVQALRTLKSISSDNFSFCLTKLLTDPSVSVRLSAIGLIAKGKVSNDHLVFKILIDGSVEERRLAISLLNKIEGPSVVDAYNKMLDVFESDRLPKELILDLFKAVENSKFKLIKDRLINLKKKRDGSSYFSGAELLYGGDAKNGRKVFFESVASCQGCHYIEGLVGDRANLGPNLSNIGRRKSREYILESILNPNAKIAEGFQRVTFSISNNLSFSGILVKEDEKVIEIIRDDNGSRLSVVKADVITLKKEKSAMPDWFSKALKAEEIRDLVEYLHTEYTVKH